MTICQGTFLTAVKLGELLHRKSQRPTRSRFLTSMIDEGLLQHKLPGRAEPTGSGLRVNPRKIQEDTRGATLVYTGEPVRRVYCALSHGRNGDPLAVGGKRMWNAALAEDLLWNCFMAQFFAATVWLPVANERGDRSPPGCNSRTAGLLLRVASTGSGRIPNRVARRPAQSGMRSFAASWLPRGLPRI